MKMRELTTNDSDGWKVLKDFERIILVGLKEAHNLFQEETLKTQRRNTLTLSSVNKNTVSWKMTNKQDTIGNFENELSEHQATFLINSVADICDYMSTKHYNLTLEVSFNFDTKMFKTLSNVLSIVPTKFIEHPEADAFVLLMGFVFANHRDYPEELAINYSMRSHEKVQSSKSLNIRTFTELGNLLSAFKGTFKLRNYEMNDSLQITAFDMLYLVQTSQFYQYLSQQYTEIIVDIDAKSSETSEISLEVSDKAFKVLSNELLYMTYKLLNITK